MNENLDYAASLDDTGNDPENLVANLDAGENPNSLEGYQNSEMASVDAGMDNNTASFNTEVQEPNMVALETTMNIKYGVRVDITISDHGKKDPQTNGVMHSCLVLK